MDRIEELFHICLKQEIDLIIARNFPFIPAWNTSEETNTQEFKEIIGCLFSNIKIKEIYKNEDNVKSSLLRAFDRYLINVSFIGSVKYKKSLANRVYRRWRDEVENPKIETVILASMLNFEVNRPIKIDGIELLPVIKSGKTIDLEKNLYKLLGFKGVKDIKRADELASYRISYFFGGNAIRVRGAYSKREEFYKYPSFPEPGHNELLQRIKNFTTLLRLFKSGDFIVGSYHSVISSPFTPSEIRSGDIKYTNGYQYPLVDKKEIERLRRFTKKFLPLIEKVDSLPSGLQIGIEYLGSSYEKNKIHEKFIDIMIALDALLGTQIETSYRVSLRSACFLGRNKAEKKDIYKKVKIALELRGKLVHGDVHPNQVNKAELEQSKLYIENIVRGLLVKLFSLYSKNTIDNNYKKTFEEKFIFR